MRTTEVKQLLEQLVEKYPGLSMTDRRPLRLHVFRELVEREPDLAPTQLSIFLGLYTRSGGYLANTIAGAARIDLNGNVVGVVSEREAAWAAKILEERREKVRARRRAKRALKARMAAKAKPAEEVVKVPAKPAGLAALRAAALARRASAA